MRVTGRPASGPANRASQASRAGAMLWNGPDRDALLEQDRAGVEKADAARGVSFDRISNGAPGIETLLTLAYSEGVALWRAIGDKAELANALYNYTFVFSVPEDPNAAPEDLDPDGEGRRASEEAYALYEELGDERGQGNVLWGRGNSKYFSEGPDAGVDNFLAALQKFRNVGDRTMEAWSLHMVGGGLLRERRPEEARPLLREALQHFLIAGDAAGMTMVIDDLSSMALADNQPERASKLWGAGRALAKATGATLASYTDGWIESELRPNVRNSIEPAELQRWAAEGAAMSLDEAVAYALGITAEDLDTLRNSQID